MKAEWKVMMNGCPFADKGEHCCHPLAGCNCRNARDTSVRIQRLFLWTMYKRRVDKPALKEWTNVRHSLRVCFVATNFY